MNRLKMSIGRGKGEGKGDAKGEGKPANPARVAANEETTVLTPVADGTDALDRLPVSVRKRWIVVAAVLAAGLLASLGMNAYLYKVTGQWQERSDETVAQNYELGDRLATEQEHGVELQAELDVVKEQLATANQRIIELVDEANQRDDNAEYYASQINDLRTLMTTAAGTANALASCVDYQQQLVGYLHNPGDYDAAELEQFEAGVNTKCDAAMEANTQLQQLLAE